jgi:hypothetical protein
MLRVKRLSSPFVGQTVNAEPQPPIFAPTPGQLAQAAAQSPSSLMRASQRVVAIRYAPNTG